MNTQSTITKKQPDKKPAVSQTKDFILDDSRIGITDKEFKAISQLVHQEFGIFLPDQKKTLVVGRLQNLLRKLDMKSFTEYIEYLNSSKDRSALSELANRISTNHTYFFRENDHFTYLVKQVLPEITARHEAANNYDLRVWCAASSSGEEPYTIAMTLMEYFGQSYQRWKAGLLATDISEKVLRLAMTGIYPNDRMQHVPKVLQNKYFERHGPDKWKVRDELRKEVTYRRFNLIEQNFPFRKPFDIIFCRNVLIYFDQPTRIALANRFYQVMSHGSYLFIGHSETLGRDQTPFQYIRPAVYRKN